MLIVFEVKTNKTHELKNARLAKDNVIVNIK